MVITNVNQVVYQGDGVTTAFPFTFRIIDATDIKLLLLDSDGTETDILSDYFVDTENDTVHYPGYAPGAEPALSDRPPVLAEGQKLVIYRKLPITQEKDLGDKWPFYVIELGLDKLTMLIQDVYGWVAQRFMQKRDNKWDARKFPIKNVGGPVDISDAATKDYVDRILSGIIASGDGRVVPFDNVAQLIDADVVAGQITTTLGYYDINDGGAGVYNIRVKTPYDVEDGGSIIFLDNGNVAELITDGTVNVKQFGAKGDNSHDDTDAIQNAIIYGKRVLIPQGDYKVTKPIELVSNREVVCHGIIHAYLVREDILNKKQAYKNTIYASGKENITIRGLTIRGTWNPSNSPATVWGVDSYADSETIIAMFNCNKIKFDNLTLSNILVSYNVSEWADYFNNIEGLNIAKISNCTNVTIDGLTLQDCTGESFRFVECTDVIVKDLQSNNNATSLLDFTWCESCLLDGGYINGTFSGDCINVNASNVNIVNLNLNGNIDISNEAANTGLHTDFVIKNVSVNNNVFRNAGIVFQKAGNNLSVLKNISVSNNLFDLDFSNYSGYAINVAGCNADNLSITNNNILCANADTSDRVIVLQNGITGRILIDENKVKAPTDYSTYEYGVGFIWNRNNTAEIHVTNNDVDAINFLTSYAPSKQRIKGNTYNGMNFYNTVTNSPTYLYVEGNTFNYVGGPSDSSSHGQGCLVDIETSTTCNEVVVKDNVCKGNYLFKNYNGSLTQSLESVILDNNVCISSASEGIQIRNGAKYCKLTNFYAPAFDISLRDLTKLDMCNVVVNSYTTTGTATVVKNFVYPT